MESGGDDGVRTLKGLCQLWCRWIVVVRTIFVSVDKNRFLSEGAHQRMKGERDNYFEGI